MVATGPATGVALVVTPRARNLRGALQRLSCVTAASSRRTALVLGAALVLVVAGCSAPSASVSPDQRVLLVGADGSRMVLRLDDAAPTQLPQLAVGSRSLSGVVVPAKGDGDVAWGVASDISGSSPCGRATIVRIDLPTGALTDVAPGRAVAVSGDGRRLAYVPAGPDPCHSGDAIVLRDVRTGRERTWSPTSAETPPQPQTIADGVEVHEPWTVPGPLLFSDNDRVLLVGPEPITDVLSALDLTAEPPFLSRRWAAGCATTCRRPPQIASPVALPDGSVVAIGIHCPAYAGCAATLDPLDSVVRIDGHSGATQSVLLDRVAASTLTVDRSGTRLAVAMPRTITQVVDNVTTGRPDGLDLVVLSLDGPSRELARVHVLGPASDAAWIQSVMWLPG